MRHIKDGALRRVIDDPLAISVNEKEHLARCATCQTRMSGIRADQDFSSLSFNQLPAPQPDLRQGMMRMKRELATAAKPAHRPGIFSKRLKLPALGWGAGLAVVLGLVVGFTPASKVLTIFQPSQFTALPVTAAEIRSLPNLKQYGYLHNSPATNLMRSCSARGIRAERAGSVQARSISSTCHGADSPTLHRRSKAEVKAGFHIAKPGWVPNGVPSKPVFHVVPAQTSSFTFSADKAQTAAHDLHKPIPPMPSDIDGATIDLNTKAAVLTTYGQASDIPQLVIGQSPRPAVTSTGVSLKSIENYVLRLPGVSPQLAQEIRSIGKPTSTLPLPIPVSWAFAQHVKVQGHPGLLVGDNTGVASIVIWQNDGVVYGVGGSLTQGQVLRIADSLK